MPDFDFQPEQEFDFQPEEIDPALARAGLAESVRAATLPGQIVYNPAVGEASEMGRSQIVADRKALLDRMAMNRLARAESLTPSEMAGPARTVGKGLDIAGQAVVGGLADIGEQVILGQQLEPGEKGNIESLIAGEEMPALSQRKVLPPILRGTLAAVQEPLRSAPRIAGVMGAQAMGVPAPIAAGILFGLTPEGFDAKSAAIGALLPAVGKWTGRLTGDLASRLGVNGAQANAILQRLGGAAGASAVLTADEVREIVKLPEEERQGKWSELVGHALSNSLLGAMGETETPKDIASRRVARELLAGAKDYERGVAAAGLEAIEPGRVVAPGTVESRMVRRPFGMATLPEAQRFMEQGKLIRRGIEQARVPQEAPGFRRGTGPEGPAAPLDFVPDPDLIRPGAAPTYEPSGLGRPEAGPIPPPAEPSVTVQPPSPIVPEVPVKPGVTDYLDISKVNTMEPDTLVELVRGEGVGGITGAAYKAASQFTPEMKTKALEFESKARKAQDEAFEAAKKRVKETGDMQELQKAFPTQLKAQFFNEAVRFYDALEAVKKGKPIEEAAQEHGVSPKSLAEARPETITAAAVQTPQGTETGPHHPGILERLGIKGFESPESRNTPNFGFQTNKRQFITREEAGPVAEKSGQNLKEFEPGEPVHSDEVAAPGTTEPISETVPAGALHGNPLAAFSMPGLRRFLQSNRKLANIRGFIRQRFQNMSARHVVDQAMDAADNEARIMGQQGGNEVRQLARTDPANVAGSAAIAVGFDRTKLPALLASVRGKNPEAEAGIQWAINNWAEAEKTGRLGQELFDRQLREEQGNGVNTLFTQDYLPGVADTDLWAGNRRPFTIGRSGGGTASGFKKGKTYANPFEAIAADAYKPRSLKLSDLVEHRLRQGQQMINRIQFGETLKGVNAPSDGKAIVANMEHRSRGPGQPGFDVAPDGYVPREILPGHRVAVHEDFAKLFDAVTATASKIGEFEPRGIPVGEIALGGAGTIKHGLLVFDTFHASRILQKQMFLNKRLPSYRKGYSLLEYNDRALNGAVANREITPEMANWIRANRADAELLVEKGFNVGRVQEAINSGLIRRIQEQASKAAQAIGVPKGAANLLQFNKWVFDKVTRGAMLESGLIELKRVMKNNPEMSREEAASKVARDLNAYFGNLGRQGVFKSPTLMDASRLAMLAPQWVEGMARSEILGAGQLAKGALDAATKRRLAVGSLGAGLGQGLVAYMVATQILNLATRRQFTWENSEKGHKLDAWIPDITGKTTGYFISPMSVVAELSHDMLIYFEQEHGGAGTRLLTAANRIRKNRSSPYSRAWNVIWNGRDWDDRKLANGWDRAKAAAWALAPTPLPLSPVVRGSAAGQTQRQLMGSAGFKTELAGSNLSQISSLARDWMAQSADPKIKAKFEREQKTDFGESDYKDLRQSLRKEDFEGAQKAYEKLLEMGKKPSVITKTMQPFSIGESGKTEKPIVGLSVAQTRKFLRTLNPEQKKTWERARKERKEEYDKFKDLLKGMRSDKAPKQFELEI